MYILGLQCDLDDVWVEIILFLALWIHEIPLYNNISILDPLEMRRCNHHMLLLPKAISVQSFTRHSRCHRGFQLFHCILHSLLIFFTIWINEINSSHLSSIVKFWLLFCPFLFFTHLSGFPNLRSIPQATHDQVWKSIELLSVSYRTTYILWEVSLPIV